MHTLSAQVSSVKLHEALQSKHSDVYLYSSGQLRQEHHQQTQKPPQSLQSNHSPPSSHSNDVYYYFDIF